MEVTWHPYNHMAGDVASVQDVAGDVAGTVAVMSAHA
jgi:hypothetical protein